MSYLDPGSFCFWTDIYGGPEGQIKLITQQLKSKTNKNDTLTIKMNYNMK